MAGLLENRPDGPAELPIGTQVIALTESTSRSGRLIPANAVGYVADHTGGQYRVQFPDGEEGSYSRVQLRVMRVFVRDGLDLPPASLDDWRPYIIYQCVIGSRAYGLSHEGSDTDRRGIYLPPAELQWSLQGVPEQVESDATQESYWELKKFLVLALKANPNILECLYSPIVERASPLAQELLDMRECFLSRLVYQTYNGYVLSQFRKIRQDERTLGVIRWKHAMHLIRLVLSGVRILREGAVPVHVGDLREQLLAVRRGEIPWPEVDAWRLRLHREFDEAFAQTSLPERPDYERVNAFLVKARRTMA